MTQYLPRSESLPSVSWPGMYPIYYLTESGETCCSSCAEPLRGTGKITPFMHWEGEPIHCDGCDKELDSVYGPIED